MAVNSLGCLADGNRTTDNDSGMLSLARSLVLRKSNAVDSTGVMCRLGHPPKRQGNYMETCFLKKKKMLEETSILFIGFQFVSDVNSRSSDDKNENKIPQNQ